MLTRQTYTARASASLAVFLFICAASASAFATTFVVTNTNDSGAGSLRQAITDANANANVGGADTVSFNIPGAGVQTITLSSQLPTVTDPVIIDGYTQPGASVNTLAVGDNAVLLIEINGNNAVGTALTITAGSSMVRGLVINRLNNFFGSGIALQTNGGNTIVGNFIGTNASGTAASTNAGYSISLTTSNNTLGGTMPAERNVISGNNIGIALGFSGGVTQHNVIEGNYIGTNASGTAAIGNGVGISNGGEANNTIGGTTGTTPGGACTGACNVISGSNGGPGVYVANGGAANNVIQGNFVGTNATGTAAIPNFDGIQLNNTSGNLIGGTTASARNLVSGNMNYGIRLGAFGATVEGNFVGTQTDGTSALGNGDNGINAENPFNQIGGTAQGASNTIAFNGRSGVGVVNTAANAISGNSIYSNSALGIDLSPIGVTPNDPNDTDTGSNNLQNFPVVTSATSNGSTTTIQGTLNSTPNATFTLEFFSNNACDASGYGEGQTFLGTTPVTTGADGNASFNVTFSMSLTATQVVTATATNAGGDTSEFSQCGTVSVIVPPPPVTFNPGDVIISELRGHGVGATAGSVDPTNDFVELYNNTDHDITVQSTDGSAGWALETNKIGAPLAVIPNGKIIPARGHYLIGGATYGLGSYAAPDQTAAQDIPDEGGYGILLRTDAAYSASPTGVLDAVGFYGAPTPFVEANGAQGIAPIASDFAVEFSFVRKMTTGRPQDTNNNAADFIFISASGGTSNGQQSTLGMPGPENSSSPVNRSDVIKASMLAPCMPTTSAPNRERATTSYTDAATPSSPSGAGDAYTSGTLRFRRRFTNNTGQMLTQLRFRVVDITTLPSPTGTADLRLLTSSDEAMISNSCGATTTRGLKLEQSPAQLKGGGLNSTVASGYVTINGLAPGNTIELNFLLGVVQTGSFRFFVIVEAPPVSSSAQASASPAKSVAKPAASGNAPGKGATTGKRSPAFRQD
jgi:hypothetical protein